jgi:tripartite-type tricarboxylate transporter receptor subunit TctC
VDNRAFFLKPLFAVWMISAGIAVSGPGIAFGQSYPTKPIRVLSAEVGGGADFVARLVAQRISGPLGRQVVVENRPGRLIGDILVKATSDGYTLLLASSTILFAPLFGETLYDPVKDFSPITMLASAPNIIVVHPSVPATSVKELIALAKARPGKLNYGSGGTGSSLHLAAELFKQMAGVDITRIAYKGAGPAMNDLVGGQVQMVFATAGSATLHVRSGRLRALAVTSREPSVLAPGLPTVAASGVPGYEMEAIYALVAPLNTPPPIIKQLNHVIVLALSQTDVQEKFLNAGIEAASSSPGELGAKIKSEIAKVARLVKDQGIRAN